MEIRAKALLISVIGTVAAVGMLALVVYPFDYGVVESAVPVGLFVLAALFKYVLDTGLTSYSPSPATAPLRDTYQFAPCFSCKHRLPPWSASR